MEGPRVLFEIQIGAFLSFDNLRNLVFFAAFGSETKTLKEETKFCDTSNLGTFFFAQYVSWYDSYCIFSRKNWDVNRSISPVISLMVS